MNNLFLDVLLRVEKYLSDNNFSLKGKNTFIQKVSQFKRENSIILYSRRSRLPHEYIEITAMCNIYYKTINMLDKVIISDFMNSYPIIAGSTGIFNEHKRQYFSINIQDISEIDFVSNEIIKNIEDGAFHLFSLFPTLESIHAAIENNNTLLKDYLNPNIRFSIRRACVICLLFGKDEAIKWFLNFAPSEKNKSIYIERMKKNW
jgi:hypothetical protein